MKTINSSICLRYFAAAIPMLSAAVCCSITRPVSSSASSNPSEFKNGPKAANGLETGKWIGARVKKAKAGRLEIVRVPVVVRCAGWGSNVPENFIGTSVGNHQGGETWIKIKARRGVKMAAGRDGAVFMVEGRFTGRIRKLDLRRQDGEPAEWLYNLSELEVSKARRLTKKEMNNIDELRVSFSNKINSR